jgi:hypothetical protein
MGENEQIYDEDGDVIIPSKWPGKSTSFSNELSKQLQM